MKVRIIPEDQEAWKAEYDLDHYIREAKKDWPDLDKNSKILRNIAVDALKRDVLDAIDETVSEEG